MMSDDETELSEIQERLAEALAEVDRLQAAVADAEARAAAQREQANATQTQLAALEAELAQCAAERETLAAELRETRQTVAESLQHYREARLQASPEVPEELVSGESLEEIDRQFEAAQRIVSEMRGRLETEVQQARVPIGAPARRAQDLSGLSSQEKIRLGLERAR
jgi:septal ring factor EnvC (AmiA/AmiB activator)